LDRALERVILGLSDVRGKCPHEFSGDKLGIAIARAILSRQKLPIADELLSMLDTSLGGINIKYIEGIKKRNEYINNIYIT